MTPFLPPQNEPVETHELNAESMADLRGVVAEFRRNRRDLYPHTAVELLLEAIEDLSNIVDELLVERDARDGKGTLQ